MLTFLRGLFMVWSRPLGRIAPNGDETSIELFIA